MRAKNLLQLFFSVKVQAQSSGFNNQEVGMAKLKYSLTQ